MSFFTDTESTLRSMQFYLRSRLWGRVRLRRRLPVPALPETDQLLRKELALYGYFLECANSMQPEAFKAVESVWDVGCRNWSYAPALAKAFAQAHLFGCELDGGRRYWNLYRRIDVATSQSVRLTFEGRYAKCFASDFCDVEVSDSLGKDEPVAFCFFFPFVSDRPCVKWGLPKRYAQFEKLLAHAKQQAGVNPTLFFSVHQGEWEADQALMAYAAVGLSPKHKVLTPDDLQPYWPLKRRRPYPIHLLLSKKSTLGEF